MGFKTSCLKSKESFRLKYRSLYKKIRSIDFSTNGQRKITKSFKIFTIGALISLSMPVFPSNNNILDLGSLSIEGEVRRPVLPYSTSQKKIFSVAGYLINDEFEFKCKVKK